MYHMLQFDQLFCRKTKVLFHAYSKYDPIHRPVGFQICITRRLCEPSRSSEPHCYLLQEQQELTEFSIGVNSSVVLKSERAHEVFLRNKFVNQHVCKLYDNAHPYALSTLDTCAQQTDVAFTQYDIAEGQFSPLSFIVACLKILVRLL